MQRARTFAWLTPMLAVLIAVPGVPARAQQSPLAQVPEKSALVVHLKGLDRTKERLFAMLKNAVPDFGPVAALKIDEKLKELLDGRELKGLAKDGPIFLAFTDMPKRGADEPNLALIARVTDYKTFRDGLLKDDERKTLKSDAAGWERVTVGEDREYYFVDRKDYAVVTPRKEVAVQFTKPQPGLDKKLTKDIADSLLKSDIAVYVDMVAVNKEYGEQIRGIKDAITPLIQLGLQQQGQKPDEATIAAIQKVIDTFVQALSDGRAALLTMDVRPEGVGLRLQLQVSADSMTNTLLKTSKPSTLKELGDLPPGKMIYSASQIDPELQKSVAPLIGALAGTAGDGEFAKQMKEAFEQLAKAGPGLNLTAAGIQEGLEIHHYRDPVLAAKASLLMFKALKKGENFQNIAIKKAELVEEKETHRGFKLHHAALEWDFEKLAEGQPGGEMMVAAMKKLLGDGQKVWFGTDGKVFVQVTGKDWKTAQGYLDEYLDGKATVGKDKAFQDARKMLPEQATAISLINIPVFAQVMGEFMGALLQAAGLPVGQPPPPPAKFDTAYMGFAFTLQPESASVDVWIPVETVKEFRRVFEPMFKGLIPGADAQ